MKLVTIVGARPQFIKASVVSKAIKNQPSIKEVIIHTGQHFDSNMSDVFFDQLNIPRPDYQFDIHGCSHAQGVIHEISGPAPKYHESLLKNLTIRALIISGCSIIKT